MFLPRLVCTAALLAGAASAGDGDIQKVIQEKFARGKLAADHFSVKVQNGVATIEGETAVSQRKGAATRIAKTAGAREVRNCIRVKPSTSGAPPQRAQVVH
jgi:hypothetical protein